MQPHTRLNLLILLYTSLSVTVQAFIDTKLTGTWSSKSRQVVTGPDFYDPVNDVLREPPLTGISYSFTDDGYYEEAYYRAISNPTRPECPKGIMQWQHGTYSLQSNGSLILTPIASDGRQLLSDPCAAPRSSYTRYNQSVLFESYRIYTDSYHGILRLDLSKFDGSLMQPLYILYRPPAMLPTTTLDSTGKASQKAKRAVDVDGQGYRGIIGRMEPAVIEHCWWFGIISIFVGGLMMWCS